MRPGVLVTGGATGFGRVFAEEMCRAGAAVVITGRDSGALRQARDELPGVCAVTMDSTDRASVEAAVTAAEAASGPLDALVHVVDVAGPVGPAWEVDQDDWWRAVEVALRGTAVTTAAVLARMVPRKHGRIVTVVSHATGARATACSVAKAAVVGLTEGLAAETREHGVTVLSYHPGPVDPGAAGPAAAEAAAVLRRIVEGTADHRSGEHLTAEDPLVRTAWEPMPLSW
ncbi:SDR family NAD(P)-dependent oxidoreductase [Lentzea chajnantorensis]